MAQTTFVDKTTVIEAEWLNDVDGHVWNTGHRRYVLGTTAAAAQHPEADTGSGVGFIIETDYLDSTRTLASGSEVAYTRITVVGKAGDWPNADGFFYDADGKKFQIVPTNGAINTAQFGVLGNGTTNDIAALIVTDAAAAVLNFKLTGTGTILISSTWTPTANNIDLSTAVIKIDTGSLTAGVILTGYSNENLNVNLRIDGNEAGQSGAGIGVNINDVSTPFSDINIRCDDCKKGVLIDGSSEKLNIHVKGTDNTHLVDVKAEGGNTPDGLNLWITSTGDKLIYQQSDQTTARVIFNCEANTGAADFAVKILDAKYVSLGGLLNAMVAGGVEINDSGGNTAVVNFEGLSIYGCLGGYALSVPSARTLSGNVSTPAAGAGGTYLIDVAGGASLQITSDGLVAGSGLRLGDAAGNPFLFGTITYTALGTIGATDVNLDNVLGQLSLDMTASDHLLTTNSLGSDVYIEMSAKNIGADLAVVISGTAPTIHYRGTATSVGIEAFSSSNQGMRVDSVSNALHAHMPSFCVDGTYWTNVSRTITGSTACPTAGLVLLNSVGGAVTPTLANGTQNGQQVHITMSDASSTSTLTVTNHATTDPETFLFNTTDDYLILEWQRTDWITVFNRDVGL